MLVDRYLFDPHDGSLATPAPPGVRRLFLPAVRAFGTGSHESTRLAVRLLLAEDLAGRARPRRRLRHRARSRSSRLSRAPRASSRSTSTARPRSRRASRRARTPFPASPRSRGRSRRSRKGARFDVIAANMIHEETAPLLPALRAHLAPGGRLLCSGQLAEREGEWEDSASERRLPAGSFASGERMARDRVGFFE